MVEPNTLTRFEAVVLPHLAAAYNLARWLTRNDQDAEDLVQEAYLRALKSFEGFYGGDGRGWILAIVRNACYTWLQQNRRQELAEVFDEEVHTLKDHARSPEAVLLRLRYGCDDQPVIVRALSISGQCDAQIAVHPRKSDSAAAAPQFQQTASRIAHR